MAKYTLEPGKKVAVPTGGRFLNVISCDSAFFIENLEKQLSSVTMKQGATATTAGIDRVYAYTDGNTPVQINVESQNIAVSYGGNGAVAIENEPWLAGIRQAIQVDAQATVENGKMQLLVADNREDISVMEIAPGQRKKFASGKNFGNRQVNLFLVSDASDDDGVLDSMVTVGGDFVDENSGDIVTGSIASIGAWSESFSGDVWVYNRGAHTAKVQGSQIWRGGDESNAG